MKRADTGEWAMIGGLAEEGASFHDTAITELYEEAAIKANAADLIPFATLSDPKTNTFMYPNGDHVQIFTHSFIIRKWQQLPHIPDEHEVLKLEFFQLDNLPDNISEITKQELKAYKQYLATGEFQSY
jgi:ADP-ribose pyrophosphatase YjhB (NUDIX family)